MKNILLFVFFILNTKAFAQVIADVGVDTMYVTDFSSIKIDENLLPLNGKYQLKIPIFNKSIVNQVPLGTCKIKIGLGSKLILDPSFNLQNSKASEYFDFTSTLNSGQIQITGDLKQALPINYLDTLSFDVIGNIQGISTITTNFLISNHNSSITLSDSDPINNSTFLHYTIIIPVPVNFTSINAVKNKCSITVLFTAEREYEVIKYEIETSKDGINYTKVGTVEANQNIRYSHIFMLTASNIATTIYIRVKSLDRDGQYQLSATKQINGQCTTGLQILAYPNPIITNHVCNIKAITGNFTGNYQVFLYDELGNIISTKNYSVTHATELIFPLLTTLPSSMYLLRVINTNDLSQEYKILLRK